MQTDDLRVWHRIISVSDKTDEICPGGSLSFGGFFALLSLLRFRASKKYFSKSFLKRGAGRNFFPKSVFPLNLPKLMIMSAVAVAGGAVVGAGAGAGYYKLELGVDFLSEFIE